MMNTDTIAIIANLALTLSFIVGLVFGLAQVKAAARDRNERFTLDTMRNFQTREFAEFMYYVGSFKPPVDLSEWRKLPANDQIIFIQFSQQMESLGLLVAERYVNIDLVDKTLGNFVIMAWDKFKSVMLDIRKDSDPFIGEYFEWLADQLSERMKNNPRKRFNSPHSVSPQAED